MPMFAVTAREGLDDEQSVVIRGRRGRFGVLGRTYGLRVGQDPLDMG
jgi:hypothetical protein